MIDDNMRIAFIEDIRAHPDEDAPRLIYADWLSDNGRDAQASYIRQAVACPHEAFVSLVAHEDVFPALGIPAGEPQPVGAPGTRREYRTWMWSADDDLRCLIHDLGRDMAYRLERGLIEVVRAKAEDWLLLGRWLVRRHPVRRVAFRRAVRVMGGEATIWRGGWDGDVPRLIFDGLQLPKCKRRDHVQAGTHCHAASKEVAEDALSAAALVYAHQKEVVTR